MTVLHFREIRAGVFNLELWWSVAKGEFEIFHVRQHSNMLIISSNCCIGGVLPSAFAFALGGYTAGGFQEYECFFLSETCCYLLSPTEYKAGGAMLLGDGILCQDGISYFI